MTANGGVRIFDHRSFASYFSAFLAHSKANSRTFSLRYLCRQSGVKSPSMFTWFASGKRLPTPEILDRLSEALKWSPAEHAYAQLMVGYEKSDSSLERSHLFEKMQAITAPADMTTISAQAKSVFSKWYTMAILEMTNLADFQCNAEWISKRLGSRITSNEIEEAIEILKEEEFLIDDGNGGWQRNTASHRTRDNVSIKAVRGWHSQMMKLGQQAIHIQDPDERFFTGATLTISASQLKQAQALIAEFREKFIAMTQVSGGDETYHFAIQFFRLTGPLSSDEERRNLAASEAATSSKPGKVG